jgi:glycosyltransferase involved in cell wall biosynthesis
MSAPIISVIMPVFNAAQFVGQAIESILKQTSDDFELIVINDGSTDNSLQVIQKYASLDSRIILISRENRGVVASRVEGVKLARGHWIAWMDADDISAPQRLENQLHYVQQKDLDICGTWAKCFGARKIVWKYPISNEAIIIQLLFDTSFCNSSVFGKSEVFKTLSFQPDFPVAEDYDLWQRAASTSVQMGNMAECLIQYRMHRGQLSDLSKVCMTDLAQQIRLRQWVALCGEERRLEACELLGAFIGQPVRHSVIYPMLAELGKSLTGEARDVFVFNIFRIFCRTAATNQNPWVTWGRLLREIGMSPRPSQTWILKFLKHMAITSGSSRFKALKNTYLRML